LSSTLFFHFSLFSQNKEASSIVVRQAAASDIVDMVRWLVWGVR
jgi:hypothetical protein